MITIKCAENALKQVYLSVIQNQLNSCVDPVLSKMQQTTADVYGKEIIIVDCNGVVHKTELENLYAAIKLTDKAIRVSQNNVGAFVELLNSEIENLMLDTKARLLNSFYGEDEETKLSGLKDLFEKSNDAQSFKIDGFDIDKIREILDNNPQVDFMICNSNTKRLYQKYCEEHHIDTDVVAFSNGFRLMLFDKMIPIQTNMNIPNNTIYLINTQDFKIHQLCDWEWLENANGEIIRLIPNSTVYEATLVKYCDIVCHNKSNQIKIKWESK